MSNHIVVLSTASDDDEAGKIAHALVENRLAACVNIVGPVRSVYRWQGQVRDDSERLLVIKTVRDRFAAIRRLIGELHSYELPETIAVAIEQGDPTYLNWLTKQATDPIE